MLVCPCQSNFQARGFQQPWCSPSTFTVWQSGNESKLCSALTIEGHYTKELSVQGRKLYSADAGPNRRAQGGNEHT